MHWLHWVRFGVSVLAVALVHAGCAGAGSTSRCVYEDGSTAPGRCLTECESRCNLETAAGCAPPACVAACDLGTAQRTRACIDADYTHWRCLRAAHEPHVVCTDGVPTLVVEILVCEVEQRAEDRACEGQNLGDPPIPLDAGADTSPPGATGDGG